MVSTVSGCGPTRSQGGPRIHTASMLDKITLVPYAGSRILGLAIESIDVIAIPGSGTSVDGFKAGASHVWRTVS